LPREISCFKAILEATDQCMAANPAVYIMGLGVSDPRGVFGTTLGISSKYGLHRALDMPVSENAMTGIAIGSALVGMRPIITHQRTDFMLLSLDQIINNAAKWHYMFGGQMKVPIVLRLLVGRGWGQGPQHSQNFQALFAHVPGLKVVLSSTPYDAKGLLISSIEDDDPVIFIEHRWLHGIVGPVPEKMYRIPLGKSRVIRKGRDVTIIASSYMTIESIKASVLLKECGLDAEVLDLRTIKPLDEHAILSSIKKTGRLVAVDGAWRSFGVSAEILSLAVEKCYKYLKCAPRRITFPDASTPTSWALANHYYPKAEDIVRAVKEMFGIPALRKKDKSSCAKVPLDVPDESFTGPF